MLPREWMLTPWHGVEKTPRLSYQKPENNYERDNNPLLSYRQMPDFR
jgi:hypothetical protein